MNLILILIIVSMYVLFISRSKVLGKFLYTQFMNLERKRAKLHNEIVVVDDVPITLYRSNEFKQDKPTLLLLHGFSADKSIWHRFAMQAKDDYNLVIPDMLGHGDTPYSVEQSYSTLAQTAMLMKLLSQLKITQYSVIGNSMGGMIAMRLLLQDGERLAKAVLLDPAGVKSEFAMQRAEKNMNPFLIPEVADFFAFYNKSMARPPFAPPSVLHYVGEVNYVQKYKQFAHMFRDFFNMDEFFDTPFEVDASRLKIIWGEKDQLLPVADSKLWATLSGCQADIYPNIGHMPMVECTKVTYDDCHHFIHER
ncbi:alpha/beta fold hydrolase [Glaciecola sp. SC05]|uniref:alpha/beta fold hydrolase n=1 Tax=Glaciecola sp. SC05 TaxID=1987355 RepID=UPI00352971A2